MDNASVFGEKDDEKVCDVECDIQKIRPPNGFVNEALKVDKRIDRK